MITSTKSILRKKPNRQNPRTNGKSSYRDKITQRSIHIHTHKKRKRNYIYIYLYIKKKGSEQPNEKTNLPVIINSKY